MVSGAIAFYNFYGKHYLSLVVLNQGCCPSNYGVLMAFSE